MDNSNKIWELIYLFLFQKNLTETNSGTCIVFPSIIQTTFSSSTFFFFFCMLLYRLFYTPRLFAVLNAWSGCQVEQKICFLRGFLIILKLKRFLYCLFQGPTKVYTDKNKNSLLIFTLNQLKLSWKFSDGSRSKT